MQQQFDTFALRIHSAITLDSGYKYSEDDPIQWIYYILLYHLQQQLLWSHRNASVFLPVLWPLKQWKHGKFSLLNFLLEIINFPLSQIISNNSTVPVQGCLHIQELSSFNSYMTVLVFFRMLLAHRLLYHHTCSRITALGKQNFDNTISISGLLTEFYTLGNSSGAPIKAIMPSYRTHQGHGIPLILI